MTMIELMVSLTILALVSSSFAYGLQLAMSTTREDRARVQASNLAARELEIVRNEFGASKTAPATLGATSQVTNPHPLPGGTAGQPLDLDGTKFTVRRTVEWLPAGTGTSPCDGGTAVTYPSLGVNVRVSWADNTNKTRDVESNTVLTPPKGTLPATIKGFIAAKVQGADGKPVESLRVDISGPGGSDSRVTAGDGCAVFGVSTAGNYTVTLNVAGYVSFDGQPSTSKPAVVAAGSIQIVPFSYDAAATLVLDHVITDGVGPDFKLPVPKSSVTLFNPSLPTMGKKEIASGTTTVSGLWPFPDGYSVWAGTCAVNDPTLTGGKRAAPVIAAPGQTKTAEVALRPVQVTFFDSSDQPLPNRDVVATVINQTGCKEKTLSLGKTNAEGVVRSALPYGQWTVAAGTYSTTADVRSDGSVGYPLELQAGGS